MDHSIITDGPFEKSFDRLVTAACRISWYDRFLPRLSRLYGLSSDGRSPTPGPMTGTDIPSLPGAGSVPALLAPERKPPTRVKYTCPSCEVNVWGKPGLNISCDDCEAALEPVD
jgi:hypothetical protein